MQSVVPLAGDVDRNSIDLIGYKFPLVVPLAGDVDRNSAHCNRLISSRVVPLAGDVDRNMQEIVFQVIEERSSPSRGTWIEIGSQADARMRGIRVVPLAGDVDRNMKSPQESKR